MKRIRFRSRIKKPVSFKRKVLRGTAASAAGLGILLAGMFHTPADLLQQQTIDQLDSTPAVMMVMEEEPESEKAYQRLLAGDASETKGRAGGFFQRLRNFLQQALRSVRNFILGLPLAVRACIGIPLWAAGYGIIHLLSLLFSTVMAPVLSHLAGFLLLFIGLLAVFAVTMKCLFPKMPLRKILRKKNLWKILIGAAALKFLDFLLPLFWNGYVRYKYAVLFLLGLVALGFLIIPVLIRRKRRQQQRLQQKYPAAGRESGTGMLQEKSAYPETAALPDNSVLLKEPAFLGAAIRTS